MLQEHHRCWEHHDSWAIWEPSAWPNRFNCLKISQRRRMGGWERQKGQIKPCHFLLWITFLHICLLQPLTLDLIASNAIFEWILTGQSLLNKIILISFCFVVKKCFLGRFPRFINHLLIRIFLCVLSWLSHLSLVLLSFLLLYSGPYIGANFQRKTIPNFFWFS